VRDWILKLAGSQNQPVADVDLEALRHSYGSSTATSFRNTPAADTAASTPSLTALPSTFQAVPEQAAAPRAFRGITAPLGVHSVEGSQVDPKCIDRTASPAVRCYGPHAAETPTAEEPGPTDVVATAMESEG
jgi:hypothetical protein